MISGARVQFPPSPPKKAGNFDRITCLFLLPENVLRTSKYSYSRTIFIDNTEKQRRRGAPSAAAFCCYVNLLFFPSETNRSHRGVSFNLRGIVLTEGKSFNLSFSTLFSRCLLEIEQILEFPVQCDAENKRQLGGRVELTGFN